MAIILKNDDERRAIEEAYQRFLTDKNFSSLGKFEIKALGESLTDCIDAAMISLGIPGTLTSRDLIENPSNIIRGVSELSPGERMIAFYYDPKFTNAALYLGNGRFSSVWDGGYFLEHGLNKVPFNLGNKVTFYRINQQIVQEARQLAQTHDF